MYPHAVPHFPAPMAILVEMSKCASLVDTELPFRLRPRSMQSHKETICVQCLLHPRSQPTAPCHARPPSSEHAAFTGRMAVQAHALLIRHLAGVIPSHVNLVVCQLLQVIIVIAVHRLQLAHVLARVI